MLSCLVKISSEMKYLCLNSICFWDTCFFNKGGSLIFAQFLRLLIQIANSIRLSNQLKYLAIIKTDVDLYSYIAWKPYINLLLCYGLPYLVLVSWCYNQNASYAKFDCRKDKPNLISGKELTDSFSKTKISYIRPCTKGWQRFR